jgi:hypothetical protein
MHASERTPEKSPAPSCKQGAVHTCFAPLAMTLGAKFGRLKSLHFSMDRRITSGGDGEGVASRNEFPFPPLAGRGEEKALLFDTTRAQGNAARD